MKAEHVFLIGALIFSIVSVFIVSIGPINPIGLALVFIVLARAAQTD